MSNVVLNAVFNRSRSKGVARLVLLSIADRSANDGKAWCGAEDIARRCNIDKKNVPRHINQLVKTGELSVQSRAGKRCCNVYQIQLDPLRVRDPQGEGMQKLDTLRVSKRRPHGESTPLMVREKPL
jgi:hypothetical protein